MDARSIRGDDRRWDLLVGAAAVAAFALLVWLGRGLTFFADEWAVIQDRPIGLDTFFRPFNEHWLGVTTLVHRALVETVGLGTYVPYLALLALLHVVVAIEVYVLARRATSRALAAAITVIVLFFGSGFENLFWAMQIGFVGAIAMGLAAVLLLERPTSRRVAGAVALLTVGVATSGYGLFMLAFAGLDLLADPTRRRWFPALLVPAGAYLAWYLTLGRSGVGIYGNPFGVDRLLEVPRFIVAGAGAAMGGALGLGPTLGVAAAAALVGWLAWLAITRRSISARALACFGAIVVMYALLALVRGGLEVDATAYTRYTYLSGILALLGLAALVGRRGLPDVPRRRLAAITALALVFTLSLGWNLVLLVQGRALYAERAEVTRALVALGLSDQLPAGVDPDLTLVLVPRPMVLHDLVARFGSPLADSLAGDAVPAVSAEAAADALDRATHPPAWLTDLGDGRYAIP